MTTEKVNEQLESIKEEIKSLLISTSSVCDHYAKDLDYSEVKYESLEYMATALIEMAASMYKQSAVVMNKLSKVEVKREPN